MLALVSKKFAISMRPKSFDTDNISIQFYARSFTIKETLDLGNFTNVKIEDSFCQVGMNLQNILKNDTSTEADILTVLKKTWWQYTDNIYNIHLSIADDRKQTAFLLATLEFYAQRFSLEMVYFLDSLSLSDKEKLHNTIGGDIDSNDSYYSELLAAKSFSQICTSIGSGSFALQSKAKQ
jgi:phosphopantetheinyl transferase (holo-ACP synthase)